MLGDMGARIVKYEDLLFPQYIGKAHEISQDTLSALQEKAKENITGNPNAHPDVIAHWKKLASGENPTGFNVVN